MREPSLRDWKSTGWSSSAAAKVNEPVRHDWRKVISGWKELHYRLHKSELTNYKIGLASRLHHSVITRLETRAGAEPPHYSGELILFHFAEISARYAHVVVANGSVKAESALSSGR